MEKILKKYQERLINLSSRNSSLLLKKLYKKTAFDIIALDDIIKDKSYEVFNMIRKEQESIVLIPDPLKYEKEENKELNKQIERLKTDNEILKKEITEAYKEGAKDKKEILENYLHLNIENEKEVLEALDAYKKCLIQDIIEKREELQSMSKSLDYLEREIRFIERETGLSSLYLAYEFVEGKFSDGSLCRAPLALLAVKINKENGIWYLNNEGNSELEENKVFLMAAKNNNELKNINVDFDFINDENIEEQFIELYKKNGIELSFKNEMFRKMINMKNEKFNKYLDGTLIVKKHLVIGKFPTANSIYDDYKDIINRELYNSSLSELLKGEKKDSDKDEENSLKNDISEYEEIKETNYHFLSRLDYSQELALKSARETNYTVIFGPPGTGKSETIANIITDYVASGKRVLMVSQKRAALDVIYNRLGKINNKMILIHDAVKGRKEFYKTVDKIISEFEESNGSNYHYTRRRDYYRTDYENTVDEISEIGNDIENYLDKFRILYSGLYKKINNGEIIRDICHKTWSKDEIDERKEYLINIYHKKDLDIGKNFKELKKFLMKIKKDKLIDKYYKYKQLLNKTDLFNYLLKKPEFQKFYIIEEKYSKIEEFVEKTKEKLKSEDYKNIYEIVIDYDNDTELNNKIKEETINKYGELLEPIVTGIKRFFISIFKSKKIKEEENKRRKEYENILRKNVENAIQLKKDLQEIRHLVKDYRIFFEEEFISKIENNLIKDLIFFDLEKLKYVKKNYAEYIRIKDVLETYTDWEILFIDKIFNVFDSLEECTEFLINYDKIVLYSILENELEYNSEFIRSLKITKDYNLRVKLVNKKMNEKNNITVKLINDLWDQKFAVAAKDNINYREFKRLATLKRRQRPVRKYMELYNDVIINLFPCYLMGPKTVSDVLPMKTDLFDVVIFDEASQMFVEESIPSIVRGKNVIVAGDDKQLKPTSLFKIRYKEEISDDEYQVETAAALEEESLLDLAKITYKAAHLNFHYRSKYAELINFSNYAFYDGRLKLAPNIGKDENMKPIERIFVKDGLWENRCNKEEAVEVVKLLKDILYNRKNEETVGIITFNITQKDLILDLIEIEMSKDQRFKENIQKEQYRYKGNEDVSLFVKNIENVQGDERDIIVFSTGYAKNIKGKMYSNFGALSKDGGENRLNVAVSRAKIKVYIVTSFEPEELDVENAKNAGPKLFKKYLQYSREINDGNEDLAKVILEELSNIGVRNNRDVKFDSDFEEEVYNYLIQEGYNVETQIGTSGYLIDLAIYDNITSSYVLGIECDGATYHSSPSARERDIHRQKFLETRGWEIERIWSTDWWKNKKLVIDNLIPKIENALDKRHSKYKIKKLKSIG